MDRKAFTDGQTGRLQAFRNPQLCKDDWLFIPNDLPPNWRFPQEFWPLLADAKEALGTLNGIGQTLPNPELLLHPLQTREAILSSSIEGTYVTPQQLLLYELDPREPSSGDNLVADWKEVFNYGQALKQGRDMLQQLPICSRVIRAMHATLMEGVRGERHTPGDYRRLQVQIGSSGKYIPPPALDVERLVGNLEEFVNSSDQAFDPLVLSFVVHYQFEAIHPFSDGNGRVGRALLALMIYKLMGHAMPWLYMSPYFERYRDEYSDNLFRVSTQGDWDRWIDFCLNGAIAQANEAIEKCARFNHLRAEYHARMTNPTSRSHQIIDGLFTAPVMTISAIAERFNVIYHTARTDLVRLVEAGILQETPNAHPRTFFAPEIMHIAYGEAD